MLPRPMLERLRPHLPKIVGALLTIPALVMLVRLHAFFLKNPSPLFFDDGYTVALAERIIDGRWLPYVDGCSHRGPMLYWMTAIGQFISGRFNWAGPRWLMFLTSLTTLLGLAGTGFAARMPLAGASASLIFTWLTFVTHETETAFGVTGEAVAGAFGVLALLCCTAAVLSATRFRPRLGLLALSGVFACLAGFTKQTALPLVAPLLLWVVAATWADGELSRKRRLQLVGAMLGGFALPALLILGRYAINGALHEFWYWFYTYNAQIYMAPFADVPFARVFSDFVKSNAIEFGAIGVVVAFGLARPIMEFQRGPRGLSRAYAAAGFEATTSWLALAAFVGLAAPKRFWPAYFLLLFPFLSLVIGIRLQGLVSSARGNAWAQAVGQLLLGAFLTGWFGYAASVRLSGWQVARRAGGWRPAVPEAMCDTFDKYSGPDDAVFIWGFDADLLVTCHRHPATRYTYLTLVAGAVPPFWNQLLPERVAEGAREHVVQDLRVSRPALILDMPANMRKVSLRVVPELSAYVDENYCRVPDARSSNGRVATVYLRRDLPECKGRR